MQKLNYWYYTKILETIGLCASKFAPLFFFLPPPPPYGLAYKLYSYVYIHSYSAWDMTPDKSRIPYTDLKPTINKFLLTKWQQQWSNNIQKLFQIQPTLGEWRPASRKSRREQVVISLLWIGHTRLTFILKREPQPQYLTCQTTCLVKRILIECRAFAVIRKWFLKVNSLTDLFENVKIDYILSFLRDRQLYQKITT